MKERKNKKSGVAAAVVLILALLSNLAEGDAVFVIIPLLVCAFMAAVIFIIIKAVQKTGSLPQRSGRKQEKCDYGEENHEYSHDMQRRIAQLDEFRKNGLIGKEEYAVLLRHFKEAEMRH